AITREVRLPRLMRIAKECCNEPGWSSIHTSALIDSIARSLRVERKDPQSEWTNATILSHSGWKALNFTHRKQIEAVVKLPPISSYVDAHRLLRSALCASKELASHDIVKEHDLWMLQRHLSNAVPALPFEACDHMYTTINGLYHKYPPPTPVR